MHPNIEDLLIIKMKKLLIVMGVALCAALYASCTNEEVPSEEVTRAATSTDTVSVTVDTSINVDNSDK